MLSESLDKQRVLQAALPKHDDNAAWQVWRVYNGVFWAGGWWGGGFGRGCGIEAEGLVADRSLTYTGNVGAHQGARRA